MNEKYRATLEKLEESHILIDGVIKSHDKGQTWHIHQIESLQVSENDYQYKSSNVESRHLLGLPLTLNERLTIPSNQNISDAKVLINEILRNLKNFRQLENVKDNLSTLQKIIRALESDLRQCGIRIKTLEREKEQKPE